MSDGSGGTGSDTSIATSTPWSASHRSNPLNTSTPCSREISTTATSRDLSRATTRDPAVPVAPITAMVVTAFTPLRAAG